MCTTCIVKNTINYDPKRRYLPPNIIANTVVSEKYMGIPIQTMCPIHLVICIWSPYCVRIVRFSYTDVCGVVIRPTKLVSWSVRQLGQLI